MELIEGLLGLALLCVLIAVGIGIVIFPIYFDLGFHEENGEFPLCHGFAILQLIGIMIAIGESSTKVTGKMVLAIIFTIIVTIIAMIRTANRVKSWGYEGTVVAMAVLAQMLIPVSIIIIFLAISGLIDRFKKDKK